MANRVEECLRKAEQCEQAGSFAVTLEARLMFYGLAQQLRWLTVLRKLNSNLPRSGSPPTVCSLERQRRH